MKDNESIEVIDNLKLEIKELKSYIDHMQKIISKLQTENKKVKLEYRHANISIQSFKDRTDELENIIDSMKETA